MESTTINRESKLKLRSIGVQTDLRLAIRCECEKSTGELASRGAKKAVISSPTKSVTDGIDTLVSTKSQPFVTQASGEVGVGNNASDTPSESSCPRPKSSKRRGKRNPSRKGCSENASVDSGERNHQEQQQQSQAANIGARLSTKEGLDADKSNRNHGNKAGCNNSTSNKQAAASSEKKIGQSATDSLKPISRPAKKSSSKSIAGASLATASPSVNNRTGELDTNANVRASRLAPTKMEQSQAGCMQPPKVRRHEPKPLQEQLNQKHVPDPRNKLVNAYSKLAVSEPSDKQNKGAQQRLADHSASALRSSRSMNLNDEQQPHQISQSETERGNGGRNIIYLTNRDQYELRAKLMVEAVPFRMPGS